MIKVKVIRPNVFMTGAEGERRLDVGAQIELEGSEVPAFLANKVEVIDSDEGKEMETGEGEGEKPAAGKKPAAKK